MKLFPIATLSLVLLSACRLEPIERSEVIADVEGGDRVEMEFFASDQHRARGLPFSEGVRVGDMIYLSGMLGRSPETRQLVEGGVHQAWIELVGLPEFSLMWFIAETWDG